MSADPPVNRVVVLGRDEAITRAVEARLGEAGVARTVVCATLPGDSAEVDAVVALEASPGPALDAAVREGLEDLVLQDRLARLVGELRLLEAAVDQARDGMVVVDGCLEGAGPRIRWANAAFCSLVNKDRPELVGVPLAPVLGLRRSSRRLILDLAERGAWDGQLVFSVGDVPRHLEVHVGAVRGGVGDLHHVAVVRDVTQKKRVEDRLVHLAHHDHLTGLPNRKLLLDRLEHALARGRRYEEQVGILFIDLDGFKSINDTVGHAAGDRVLQAVADRLVAMVRASDTVARLGGDEFVLVLPGVGSIDNAIGVADKILSSVSEVIPWEDQELLVTPSVGITLSPDHGDDASTLMRHADHAMYAAKAEGKATYVVWNEDVDAEEQQLQALADDLARAVAAGRLHLDGQSLVDARTDEVVGVELLLRWNHAERGPISPATFLPLLAEAGLDRDLLPWMLGRALPVLGEVRTVAVDVRPSWLDRPDLVAHVKASLIAVDLSPERLQLEVAEALLISMDGAAEDRLRALRELGVRVVVDHYGTSHLSLPQLRSLPLDALKLDPGLVGRVREDEALVAGLATLCRSLDLELHATGVESRSASRALVGLGVVVQQGGHHGRPLVLDPRPTRLAG